MNDIYNRKDEEFTVIGEVPEPFKLNDPLYKEGFQAGAASRDAKIEAQQKRIELYEQALKASWPEGAIGDVFNYWNAARKEQP